MKYTAYTFAVSDFVSTSVACCFALGLFLILGVIATSFFKGVPISDFQESEDNASFEDTPDLSETGIACEIAKLPPGSQLVEVDTAGMLTPPQHVWVHEYVWTGSKIQFVRRVPLHEFDFLITGSAVMHAISHPDALAAQETFLRTTASLR